MWLLWLCILVIFIFVCIGAYNKFVKPKLKETEETNEVNLKKSKEEFDSKIKQAEETAQKTIEDGKSLLKKVKEIKK